MFSRLRPVIAVCALALALGGCAASSDLADPPPAFSSEADAFAAAEETYRAYVDALNQVDLSDPETFEAVYAWTTGDLNAEDRRGLSKYYADAIAVKGESVPLMIAGSTYSIDAQSVSMSVCLDVSAVDVLAGDGSSLVDRDRVDVQSLAVVLELDTGSPTGLLVTEIGPREGEPFCAS